LDSYFPAGFFEPGTSRFHFRGDAQK